MRKLLESEGIQANFLIFSKKADFFFFAFFVFASAANFTADKLINEDTNGWNHLSEKLRLHEISNTYVSNLSTKSK